MSLFSKSPQNISKVQSQKSKEINTSKQETKPILKSILKADSKHSQSDQKHGENIAVSSKQGKGHVMFKSEEHMKQENFKAITGYELVGDRMQFKNYINKKPEKGNTKMLPDISLSNASKNKIEDIIFKNWVTSQSFPEIPKNSFRDVFNLTPSNSTPQDINSTWHSITSQLEGRRSFEATDKLSSQDVKSLVDKTIADGKIYVCNGPYPCLRAALNKRGWIEQIDIKKTSNSAVLLSRILTSNNNNTNDKSEMPLFYQNIDASRVELAMNLLKHETPNFFFTVKATEVVNLPLKAHQVVNHFGKASSFTTKVGLTQSLRNLPFFADKDMHEFYPRSYCFMAIEEKNAFIDDYQFTSCVGFLKHFLNQCKHNLVGKKVKDASSPHFKPILAQQQKKLAVQPKQTENKEKKENIITKPFVQKHQKEMQEEIQTVDVRVLRERLQGSNNIKIHQDSMNSLKLTINLESNLNSAIQHTLVQLDRQLSQQMDGCESGKHDFDGLDNEQNLTNQKISPRDVAAPQKEQVLQQQNWQQIDNNNSNNVNHLPSVVTTPNSKIVKPLMKHISVKALKFALKNCQLFLDKKSHKDLTDFSFEGKKNDVMIQKEWKSFLDAYKLFVTDQIPLEKNSKSLQEECKTIMNQLSKFLPQLLLDGYLNVWILKPGAKSRGRGIQCTSNYSEIVAMASSMKNCVVQKYIEKPLLIYDAKFDLRQWFLITDWNPLTLWFYKDCYLRFCSEAFTLGNLHESIHLSNNFVQKKYQVSADRSPCLPDDNMWTSDTFKIYLKKKREENVWEEKVQPQMRESIINVLLCTQDIVENRKGSFELYGADFMMCEDYSTWLLEINSSPCMARTTNATSILVDKVLEDTVKVTVDRMTDPAADTGGFEVVYQQPLISSNCKFDRKFFVKADQIKAIFKATYKP